jgi:hypothetical protein
MLKGAFIDPRAEADPAAAERDTRTASDPAELTELRRLCRDHRLYEVESWI